MSIDVKAILLKRVDLKGLLIEDVLQGVIKAALEKFVKDTSNPYDDALEGMLYPMLEAAMVKFVEDQYNKLKA